MKFVDRIIFVVSSQRNICLTVYRPFVFVLHIVTADIAQLFGALQPCYHSVHPIIFCGQCISMHTLFKIHLLLLLVVIMESEY